MPKFWANFEDYSLKDSSRNSVGGSAILPKDCTVPACRRCNSKMFLFIQFDIQGAWQTAGKDRSHFVLFMCPKCNEIPSFDELSDGKLPEKFWEVSTEGHFFTALFAPDQVEQVLAQDPILVAQKLRFESTSESGYIPDRICVGGKPVWLQSPEEFTCSCGSKLEFISQISENLGFEKQTDAPSQPDSFSANEYCLFLGNEVYIFACPRQCDPRSVWITVQG